jgi:hypothetical protein
LVACLVVLGGAIAIAGGSAGNREGTATLQATSAVSYGQIIAYKASFSNDGRSSFTHVVFEMQPPAVAGTTLKASSPQASSDRCAVDAAGAVSCDFGKLRSGDPPETLTVVWQAPGDISLPGCADCLVASSTWRIKEGKATNGNETFSATEKAGLLGTSSDPALSARQRAGGYQLGGCTAATGSSLKTDQSLDAANNPVSTSFCIPSSFTAPVDNGLQSAITEPPKTSPSYARQSDVCVAQPGQDCDDPNYLSQNFSPELLTVTFRVAAAALPKKYVIYAISHDGGAPVKEGKCGANGFCVVSIDFDKWKQTWTMVVTSPTNGRYTW